MKTSIFVFAIAAVMCGWQRPGNAPPVEDECRSNELEPALSSAPPELKSRTLRSRDFSERAANPSIRLVYLVPKDRSPRTQFPPRLTRAAQHAQLWYRGQITGRRTYRVPTTPAETVQLEENALFYTTNQPGSDPKLNFWSNVLKEMKRRMNADFEDPATVWVFYADIDARGQSTGAHSGIVLIDEGDVTGILGQSPKPLCRWVGGLGHELGHAFGLSHPAKCDVAPSMPQCKSLMYTGYVTYPNTELLSTDGQRLLQSPFFGRPSGLSNTFDCSKF
jgi:hypothetical protein